MYTRTPFSSIKGNSLKPPDTISVFVDVVGVFDTVFVGVGFKPIYKRFPFQGGQTVILAPIGVNMVERSGADSGTLAENSSFCDEIHDIAVFRNRLGDVLPCFLAYRKMEVVLFEPSQPVQHPAEYLFLFDYELIREERVVPAVGGFGFSCEDKQATGKSVRFVVQGFRRAVPETQKTAVNLRLLRLLALCLNINRYLCGDDVFDVAR